MNIFNSLYTYFYETFHVIHHSQTHEFRVTAPLTVERIRYGQLQYKYIFQQNFIIQKIRKQVFKNMRFF